MLVAGQLLPAGLRSTSCAGPLRVNEDEIFAEPNDTPHKVFISSTSNLVVDGVPLWLPFIRLARNCLEQNCTIRSGGSPPAAGRHGTDQAEIVFQEAWLETTRAVCEGQELRAWFPPELCCLLGIPLALNTHNLLISQTQLAYGCFRCFAAIFLEPNPLRIHLAFTCKTVKQQSNYGSLRVNHHLTNQFLEEKDHSQDAILPIMPPSRHQSSPSMLITAGLGRQSVSSVGSEQQLARSTSQELASHSLGGQLTNQSSSRMQSNIHNNHVGNPSQLGGRIRKTHTCMYCGKLYTRKYGLKIHLRTHTGLKPLRCKYCGRPFSDPSNLNKHIRLHQTTRSSTLVGGVPPFLRSPHHGLGPQQHSYEADNHSKQFLNNGNGTSHGHGNTSNGNGNGTESASIVGSGSTNGGSLIGKATSNLLTSPATGNCSNLINLNLNKLNLNNNDHEHEHDDDDDEANHHHSHHPAYQCKSCDKVLVRRRDLDRHMRSRHGQLS